MRVDLVTASMMALLACGRRNFNVDGGDGAGGDTTTGRANYAFVTSSVHDGSLGGLAGADAICRDRATDAGLTGTYVAYLSATGTIARDRLSGSRGWQRLDGKPIADTPTQLANGRAWYSIAIDETGNDVRAIDTGVWSGTRADAVVAAGTCNEWLSNSSSYLGKVGSAGAGGGRGIDAADDPCSSMNRIYCFELGGERPIAAPEPVAGRLAFLTSTLWTPTGGLSGADGACAAEAAATSRPGTFRAALPLSTATAATRFDLMRPTWVRADGVPLVDTAAQFFTVTHARAHLSLTANGETVYDSSHWAGSPDAGATSTTENCNEWQSGAAGNDGVTGYGDATARADRLYVGVLPCSTPTSLLCLEE